MERDDVAYVGRVTGRFHLVAMYGDDNNFALPLAASSVDGSRSIRLSKGAFTSMNEGLNVEGYNYLTFGVEDINIYVSGIESTLTAYTPDEESLPIHYDYNNDCVGWSDSTIGTRYTFAPLEPTGYGEGLLAGIRYRLLGTKYSATGTIECIEYLDEEYNSATGLYNLDEDSDIQTISLHEVVWILIPVEIDSYIDSPPGLPSLMPHVTISQCAAIDNDNYYNSISCDNWTDHRGFSTNEDVESIIYFYSQDGTCGQSYEFTDIKGRLTQVDSSNGNSCDTCNYNGSEFTCIAPTPDPPPEQEPDSKFLDNIVVWIIVGIVILVIIILVTGIIIYVLNKQGSEDDSDRNSNVKIITID